MTSPHIESLSSDAMPALDALLRSAGLQADGLDGPDVRLFGVRGEEPAALVGSVAYERVPGAVLIRSLAVRDDLRGRGLGWTLLEHALRSGLAEGAREAMLFTEHAEGFFASAGWERVAREEIEARFPTSRQLSLCHVSAVPMRRDLA